MSNITIKSNYVEYYLDNKNSQESLIKGTSRTFLTEGVCKFRKALCMTFRTCLYFLQLSNYALYTMKKHLWDFYKLLIFFRKRL